MPDPSRIPSDYRIATPRTIAVDQPLGATKAADTAPPAPRSVDAPTTTAVLVVHGMGQQIPYQTLEQVVVGLKRAAGRPGLPSVARVVSIGDQRYRRIELELPATPPGTGARRVHVYEAYWAPLTEGLVGIRDVISFLVHAGIAGCRNATAPFSRWWFGGEETMRAAPGTFAALLLTLMIVLAVVAIGAIAIYEGWQSILNRAPGRAIPGLEIASALALTAATSLIGVLYAALAAGPGSRPLRQVTRAACMSFGLLLIVTAIALARSEASGGARHGAAPSGMSTGGITNALMAIDLAILALAVLASSRPLDWSSTSRVFLYGFATLACVLTQAWAWWWMPQCAFGPETGPVTGAESASAGSSWTGWIAWMGWGWFALVPLALFVRSLLIQYVGDVVAYVDAHTVDRFFVVRGRIKAIARDLAVAIYAAQGDDGRLAYDRVAVVGHSLGSVIAYDTLNALLVEDQLRAGALRVRERTTRLITFGSPLNKIAFIFASQAQDTDVSRDILAAAGMPLIQDYARFRPAPPFAWVNIWSHDDIISGSLGYYDSVSPPDGANRIRNLIDPAAHVPLVAHCQYWEGELVWRELSEGV